MSKKWLILGPFLVFFLFTVFGFFAFRMAFPIMRLGPVSKNRKYYDYQGVTHIHSRLSTGSGTLTEIIRAAAKTKVDFLIFTDLNVTARPEAVEGYRENVLIIWAGEYSYLGGHLLAYNMPEPLPYSGIGQAQVYFGDLLTQTKTHGTPGPFLIAAHPSLPEHPWNDVNQPGLSGMEIINPSTIWNWSLRENKISLIWSVLMLPFNPDLAFLRIFKEPTAELSLWDQTLEKRHFVGFSGVDATARILATTHNIFSFPVMRLLCTSQKIIYYSNQN